MTKELNFIDESIDIYIGYEYLTVDQHLKIMQSINETYEQLFKIAFYSSNNDLRYSFLSLNHLFYSPLSIEEVRTGNSINIKLSLEKRFLPKIETQNDIIKIILPKWSAILILTGSILSFGLEKYDKILDLQIKRADLYIKNKEIESLTKKEIKHQSDTIKMLYYQNNPALNTIENNYNIIQSQINKPNINIFQLNNNQLKNKK